MKLKARDIISGWPRSRSVSRAMCVRLSDYYEFRDKGLFPLYLSSVTNKFKQQAALEYLYIKMQQAMVNEWLTRYRLGDEVFNKSFEITIRVGYRNYIRARLSRGCYIHNGVYVPTDFSSIG